MLIVVSILLIFAGMLIPSSGQTAYDQLLSAARVLASDLAYARSLAVANNDQYTVSFSGSGNSYTLQYSGSNPALVNLPSTPFRSPTDPLSQQIQRLADLPEVTAPVKLVAAADVSGTLMTAVTNVQFNGLGGTTRSDPTWIWLASGAGSSQRYLVITINPVTGVTSIGTCSGTAPANSLLLAAGSRPPGGVGWDKAALAAVGPPRAGKGKLRW
jgi:Tfp pilus assembly protein FimT